MNLSIKLPWQQITLVLLLMVLPVSQADDIGAQVLECAGKQDDGERLSCFDRLGVAVQQKHLAAAPVVAVAEPQDEVATVQLIELKKNAYDQWLFYLDNGQVWQQIESRKVRLNESLPVSVHFSKGFLGNDRLHVANRRAPIKVSRLVSEAEAREEKELPAPVAAGPPGQNGPAVETPVAETVAQLVELKKNAYGRWLFYLDNGQVWQQVETGKVRLSLKLPVTVRFSKGFLGNDRLHINGRKALIKVSQIK